MWHRTCWEEQYRLITEPGLEDHGERVMLETFTRIKNLGIGHYFRPHALAIMELHPHTGPQPTNNSLMFTEW